MEEFSRNKIENYSNDLIFQVISWEAYDKSPDDSDDESDPTYNILMFGITQESYSVCLEVQSYTPYFFVLIPDNLQHSWSNYHTTELKNYVK